MTIIWKSVPDTKDDRGVVKRIDIIIPNGGEGVKGGTTEETDREERSTIS